MTHWLWQAEAFVWSEELVIVLLQFHAGNLLGSHAMTKV